MLIPQEYFEKKKVRGNSKLVRLEQTRPPLLTVYILQDDSGYMAKCSELDLVTEMNTPAKALDAMLEMMVEYAEDFRARLRQFTHAPNRVYHLPYVEAILATKTRWQLIELVNVKYGHVQLSAVA